MDGGGGGRTLQACRLHALQAGAVSHAELPHKTLQLLTPAGGCVPLGFLGVHTRSRWAVKCCPLGRWPAGTGSNPSSTSHVCLQAAFCVREHAFGTLEHVGQVWAYAPAWQAPPLLPWWLPEPSAPHSAWVTRVSSPVQACTPQLLLTQTNICAEAPSVNLKPCCSAVRGNTLILENYMQNVVRAERRLNCTINSPILASFCSGISNSCCSYYVRDTLYRCKKKNP